MIGDYPSAEMQSAYSTVPASSVLKKWGNRKMIVQLIFLGHSDQFFIAL